MYEASQWTSSRMARKSNLILLTSLSMMSNLSRSLGSDSRRCGSREVDAEGSESRIKLHNCLYKTNQLEGRFSRCESTYRRLWKLTRPLPSAGDVSTSGRLSISRMRSNVHPISVMRSGKLREG